MKKSRAKPITHASPKSLRIGNAIAVLLGAISSYLATNDASEAEWMADRAIAAATNLREIARKFQQ